jgi:hypothetical protein
MVAVSVDRRAAQFRWAEHAETVWCFFNFSAHRAQVACGRGESIALFVAQLARIPDLYPAFYLCSNHCEQG